MIVDQKTDKYTYKYIGMINKLMGNRLLLYITYMKTMWPNSEHTHCKTDFAEHWATRFMEGREYQESDVKGKKVLENLYKNKEIYKK